MVRVGVRRENYKETKRKWSLHPYMTGRMNRLSWKVGKRGEFGELRFAVRRAELSFSQQPFLVKGK